MQAVFFRTSAFKLLHRIENIPKKSMYSKEVYDYYFDHLDKAYKELTDEDLDMLDAFDSLNSSYTGLNLRNAVKFLQLDSDKQRLDYIKLKNNVRFIQYIKNPSKELQLGAIKISPSAVLYVANPCKEMIDYLRNDEILATEYMHYIDGYDNGTLTSTDYLVQPIREQYEKIFTIFRK